MSDRRLKPALREQWIIEYLDRAGTATPADVARQLAVSVRHARNVMRELSRIGKVRPAPGRRGLGRGGRLATRYEVAR